MNAQRADAKGVVVECGQCGQLNRVLYTRFSDQVRCGRCKTQLPTISEPIDVDDEAVFAALTESASVPVLVDFWAEWCGPCKMMAPELHRFAGNSGGAVAVVKVNTETLPSLAQAFGINAIPTLALFVRGKEVARIQGARSAAQIQDFVRKYLEQSQAQAA